LPSGSGVDSRLSVGESVLGVPPKRRRRKDM
jgi:hypothetical protein